jgi:hypothetical protein
VGGGLTGARDEFHDKRKRECMRTALKKKRKMKWIEFPKTRKEMIEI